MQSNHNGLQFFPNVKFWSMQSSKPGQAETKQDRQRHTPGRVCMSIPESKGLQAAFGGPPLVGWGVWPRGLRRSGTMTAVLGHRWEGKCCPLHELRDPLEATSLTHGLQIVAVGFQASPNLQIKQCNLNWPHARPAWNRVVGHCWCSGTTVMDVKLLETVCLRERHPLST